jgi:hypothetical protein
MSEGFRNPDDATVHRLLETARRIAVVGLSPKPHRDSNRIGRYLLDRGYEVVPVYPLEETILGQKVYHRLQDVPGRLDVVDVFRRSGSWRGWWTTRWPRARPPCGSNWGVWMKTRPGVPPPAGATIAMDRCTMIEHAAPM